LNIEQFLFGYNNGHRLLAGSTDLSDDMSWELVRKTDRPSCSDTELKHGITFGFSIDDAYALCRTWAAPEIERPGAVWTHVLLIPKVETAPLKYLDSLCPAKTPVIETFKEGIQVNPALPEKANLTVESANLLLLLSAKTTTGVKCSCIGDPIEVLREALLFCKGIIQDQPFATTYSKKNMLKDKHAVIISTEEYSAAEASEVYRLNDKGINIPSERITQTWQLVDKSPVKLSRWLTVMESGIDSTRANLKLVLEVLLLGRGVLDDYKLLGRVTAAVFDKQCKLIDYTRGLDVESYTAPDWLLGVYLFTEETWGVWEEVVTPAELARVALKAPIEALAHAIVNCSSHLSAKNGLKELAKIIGGKEFELLGKHSNEAARSLIAHNRELMFASRKSVPAKYSTDPLLSKISKDLNEITSAWFFTRGWVEQSVRKKRKRKEFLQFAAHIIKNNQWREQSSAAKRFLKETHKFTEGLLKIDFSKEALAFCLSEYAESQVIKDITQIINVESAELSDVADVLAGSKRVDIEKVLAGISQKKHQAFTLQMIKAYFDNGQKEKVIGWVNRFFTAPEDMSEFTDFLSDDVLEELGVKKCKGAGSVDLKGTEK